MTCPRQVSQYFTISHVPANFYTYLLTVWGSFHGGPYVGAPVRWDLRPMLGRSPSHGQWLEIKQQKKVRMTSLELWPWFKSMILEIHIWNIANCFLCADSTQFSMKLFVYRQVSNIRCTLVGNKIVDHSDVVGAAPVRTAPTTSSFST